MYTVLIGDFPWILNVEKIAGEPLDQTVFQYGPFVMTNQEEIQRTLMDCESVSGMIADKILNINVDL